MAVIDFISGWGVLIAAGLILPFFFWRMRNRAGRQSLGGRSLGFSMILSWAALVTLAVAKLFDYEGPFVWFLFIAYIAFIAIFVGLQANWFRRYLRLPAMASREEIDDTLAAQEESD